MNFVWKTSSYGYRLKFGFSYRLWNSTLVEDYPLVDAVYIYSRAQLRIPDDNRQDLVNDVANALTIATPDLKLKVELSVSAFSRITKNFFFCF